MGKSAGSKASVGKKAGSRGRSQAPARKVVDVVTGATSGVGIALVQELLDRGHEVRVIIIEHPSNSVDWKQLPPKAIPYIADITLKRPDDYSNLVAACRGADNIFHLAAATGRMAKPTFDAFISMNVVGTENVLKACEDANPKDKAVRFIYMSTTGVYGNNRKGEILTEESDTAPSWAYSETKLMGEQVVRSFSDANSNIKYTIARVATMYGPHYHSSFFKIIRHIKDQKMPNIGSGLNHLTVVYTEDVVASLILMSERSEAVNKTYNVTDGQVYTLKQLLGMVSTLLGVPEPKRSIHPVIVRLGAKVMNVNKEELGFLMSDRVISIDKIKRELGFRPQTDVTVGAKHMIDDFMKRYRG